MVRQANAQASTAAPPAAEKSPTRESAAGVVSRAAFSGLSVVLVGLPDRVHREVEGLIIDGGGRVLQDMPPQQQQQQQSRERFAILTPAGAEAATAADSGRRGKRSRGNPGEEAVVVVSVPAASRLPRYVLAIATGVPLLHHFWVSDSSEEARALLPASYLLPGVREASRRRRGMKSAAGGGGARRGKSTTTASAVAAKAEAVSWAALATAVTKTGTPLMGMAIGVAHPSRTACDRWAKVFSAAGAQTVRQISGDLLAAGSAKASGAVRSPGDVGRKAPEVVQRGRGGDQEATLQAALAGLDCVLSDYPEAWRRFGSGVGDCGARSRRAGGKSTPPIATGGGTAISPSLPSSPQHLPSLGHVVDACRLQGVPVVSLSWGIDCVVRGTRVRRQERPEYLAPFLDSSMAATMAEGEAPLGARALSSGINGRNTHFLPPPPSPARVARLRVFVSRAGVRYEVDDHVHFRAEEGAGGAAGRSKRTGPCSSAVGTPASCNRGGSRSSSSGGMISRTPNGVEERNKTEMAVGRIVYLERTGGKGGRVMATLEPLQRTSNDQSAAAPAMFSSPAGGRGRSSGASARGGFHVSRGGGFASPSTESSVTRGRARRARELKKVVLLAEGTGRPRSSSGRQSWQKVEASDATLLGRVSVLPAREFDARRGFCGRDPDVYVQQRLATTSLASP